ncbi:MAG: ATP-grasp domain-containing protein [Muribaculaceae bacterium]|nr:ATP-grasp domain-containing protein [Muribaculaceae bacterium]
MKTLSFLFLGGAKRVAMAQMIIDACRARGIEARIYGYELDTRCPLACVGNVVEGLRWSDPGIYDDIDRTVDSLGIDVIIPFVDPAVGIAAEYCRRVGGAVFAPVAERAVAERMFDKVAAAETFERAGLPIPSTYRAGDPCLRLIAKPRYGSASQGIVIINTLQKLYEIQSQGERYLIQERIDRRSEITVDCYVGARSGQVLAVSPRERLEVSGGEAVRTVTVDDPEAVALARRTLAATGLRGAVTVQLIRDLDDGRLMVMEVNPRLGGGAVCSVHAGADIPGLIVDDALGNECSATQARPGVLTARYLADVVFDLNDSKQ